MKTIFFFLFISLQRCGFQSSLLSSCLLLPSNISAVFDTALIKQSTKTCFYTVTPLWRTWLRPRYPHTYTQRGWQCLSWRDAGIHRGFVGFLSAVAINTTSSKTSSSIYFLSQVEVLASHLALKQVHWKHTFFLVLISTFRVVYFARPSAPHLHSINTGASAKNITWVCSCTTWFEHSPTHQRDYYTYPTNPTWTEFEYLSLYEQCFPTPTQASVLRGPSHTTQTKSHRRHRTRSVCRKASWKKGVLTCLSPDSLAAILCGCRAPESPAGGGREANECVLHRTDGGRLFYKHIGVLVKHLFLTDAFFFGGGGGLQLNTVKWKQ